MPGQDIIWSWAKDLIQNWHWGSTLRSQYQPPLKIRGAPFTFTVISHFSMYAMHAMHCTFIIHTKWYTSYIGLKIRIWYWQTHMLPQKYTHLVVQISVLGLRDTKHTEPSCTQNRLENRFSVTQEESVSPTFTWTACLPRMRPFLPRTMVTM